MRYALFLVIVLVSAYFLFFKPFLSARGIDYEVRLSTLSFQPLYLELDSLYVYIPFKNLDIFVRLSGLSVEFEKKPKLKLKEGNVNLIVKETRRKPRRSLKILLPRWLREFDIELDRFLVNYGRRNRYVSVLIENAFLKEGQLRAKAQVITPALTTNVVVKEAFLREESIELKEATVESKLFTFNLRATAREKEQKAFFRLKGTIRRIETRTFGVEPISVTGKGEVNYEGIRANLRGNTKMVNIARRKEYKDIEADGELIFKFGESLLLKGKLYGAEVEGEYIVRLLPDRFIAFKARKFVVDSELLGTGKKLKLYVKGDVSLRPDTKRVEATVESKEIDLENVKFSRGELKLTYNYGDKKGRVDLKLIKPGIVNLTGRIERDRFAGELTVSDVPFRKESISASVSYKGALVYRKGLKLSGGGFLRDIRLSTVSLNTLFFRAVLEKERINLNFYGKGIRGFVRGRLGGKLLSEIQLQGFSLKAMGGKLSIRNGHLKLAVNNSKLYGDVHLYAGNFSSGTLSFPLEGRAWLSKDKRTTASFELRSSSVELWGGFRLKNVKLKGKLANNKLEGEYSSQRVLKGAFRYDTTSKELNSQGKARLGLLEASYSFTGSPRRGRLLAKIRSDKLHHKRSMAIEVVYKGESIKAFLSGGIYRYGALELELGDARYSGTLREGRLEISKSLLKVLDRPVLELSQREASYRDGKLEMEMELRGAIKGNLKLSYGRNDYSFKSDGRIALDRLSFFTATPVKGKLKGFLDYELKIDKKGLELTVKNMGRVVAYSRLLSTPMNLWLELRALGKDLSAYINLWKGNSGATVNVGSIDLKNYYLYTTSTDLPVSYASKNLRASLRVNSRGWIDIKDLKKLKAKVELSFSGEVEVLSLEDSSGGDKSALKDVELDIKFSSSKPLRIYMPEGYVHANVRGWIKDGEDGRNYHVVLELLSGELSYFGRNFFVREGSIRISKEKSKGERILNVLLVNSSPDISIFISISGDMDNPDVVVWSEPPMGTRELLTRLIVGSTAEGIIPVTKALLKELGYVGNIKDSLAKFLGLEISLLTRTGNRGELGVSVNIKKRIARAFTIEYQQSTLKDPRETYYGGSLNLPINTFIYGRVFSDRSSEIKLRFIKKFDF